MSTKTKGAWVVLATLVTLALTAYAFGQTELKGLIVGVVTDEAGIALPGVAATLTGEKASISSQSQISNNNGTFRFVNLNPGIYVLVLSLDGFDSIKYESIQVRVGQSSPIRARMNQSKVATEVTVIAEAPLIDTKSPQISTNYSTDIVQNVPTGREMVDLMDTVPGINDRGAYGAGAQFEYSRYVQGGVTTAIRLNGVDVSNIDIGNSWVMPNYDTIEEVQVVGIGASAEYGNFTGATINVVTKSGTNELHGGLSTYFRNNDLIGDNSGGRQNWVPADVPYESQSTAYLGGPLIREKLLFFLSTGFSTDKNKAYNVIDYNTFKQYSFQAKLDWIMDRNNRFSLLYNTDPLVHSNLGLRVNSGPEVSQRNKFRTHTLYANWQRNFGQNLLMEVKYGGFSGVYKIEPFTEDAFPTYDRRTGILYDAALGFRDDQSKRDSLSTSFVYFADNLLSAAHEIKFGLDYEKSSYREYTGVPGFMRFDIYAAAEGNTQIEGQVGYTPDATPAVKRLGAYFQDNLSVGEKLTLNIGVRYDAPQLTVNTLPGVVLTKLSNLSPRFGFSYDLSDHATTVLHGSYGRYYDKMTTTGFAAGYPQNFEASYYRRIIEGNFDPTPENRAQLPELILQPDYFQYSQGGSALKGIDKSLTSPYTDVFNIGIEQLLGNSFVLSADYIHKADRNTWNFADSTEHTYEELQFTDPWQGFTIAVWNQLDREPQSWLLMNSSWAKRRHNFLIFTLRKKLSRGWAGTVSYTYQDSQGNVDNSYAEAVGYSRWGQDTDPNFIENPNIWGKLSYDRTHQFKMLFSASLPFGFMLSGDFRVLSGRAWTPYVYNFQTGIYTTSAGYALLEKRGSRRGPAITSLNARLSKFFSLGKSYQIEILADLFNIFNRDDATDIYPHVSQTYPITGEAAFGKPSAIMAPRSVRLGIRFLF